MVVQILNWHCNKAEGVAGLAHRKDREISC